MKKFLSKTREYIPIFSLVVLILTIISLILYIIVLNSVSFADFFNYNLSFPIRVLVSWITVVFPFSIAEIALFLSPIILFFLILVVFYGCGQFVLILFL